jgi:O-antigen/teichoic acid export membrane protein
MNATPYSIAALKHSALHFLIGKVVSALLTMCVLLLLVRLLALEEYGTYVILVAGMELALSITQLGLPWLSARYLPEYRLHANGKQLKHFVWQIIALSGLFSVVGALLLLAAMPWLLAPLKLAQQMDVARLYLLVLVAEGLRRSIQECILEPLLQQSYSQFSQIARNLVLLLCLGIVAAQGAVHLTHVVLAELAGAILGIVPALWGLVWHLRAHRDLPGKAGWQHPSWTHMWRTAGHMYFSLLITLASSPQVYVFLTQRFLGVEVTALFGFLLNLYGQIRSYLPSTLLFGLIRPKLMASYVGEGGMAQLAHNANFMGKISLFVLMPLLVFTWLAGGELLSLLSGGKFAQSGYYLGGLLMVLIPLSQRQILETVAVASGQSHLCSWGSVLGLLTLPLAYYLLESGLGLWSPILAMIVGQFIFNATLIVTMRLTTTYRPDAAGFFKLAAAALVGFVLSFLIKMAWSGSFQPHENGFAGLLQNIQDIVSSFLAQQTTVSTHGWLGLAIIAALACGLVLIAAYFFKPFRVEERMTLNRLFKRNIFIW